MKPRDFSTGGLWWDTLSHEDRVEIGDQLVLGSFDWRDWMGAHPSPTFMREIDEARILWEQIESA